MARLSIFNKWRGSFLTAFMLAVGALSNASAQTVFTASWGENPQDVALLNKTEVERVGPLSFCLDGEAVYVLDSMNERILRGEASGAVAVFAEETNGSGLGCDAAGNVLVWDANSLQKFDRDGRREMSRRAALDPSLSPPVIGYGVELQRRTDGSLALRHHDQSVEVIAEPGKTTRSSSDGDEAPPHYFIKRMDGDRTRILGREPGGKIVTTVNVRIDEGRLGAVLCKGVDAKGNLYVELERIADGYAHLEVHRYSPDDERLAVLALPNDYYTTVYKKTEVAADGSVYQMLTTPDGVSIVRYAMEGEDK